jgi:hypothetical protein
MVCKWCNSILFILSLSSCEVTHYHAQASTEKWVHEDSYTLGASNHTNRSDGSSRTYDGQKSFSDAMTAATTGLAAWGRVASVKSDNGLKAAQDANATRVATEKIKADAAIQQATIKATPTIVPEGTTVLYPK